MLCLVCMTMVGHLLLLLSGDVETNPGPQCEYNEVYNNLQLSIHDYFSGDHKNVFYYVVDLVSKNLRKLRNLIHKACPKWYDLGLELGVEEETLKIIKNDNNNETETCFREMLSAWLNNMTDPHPSWEGLIAALKQPYIGQEELANKVRKEQGIPDESADAAVSEPNGNG